MTEQQQHFANLIKQRESLLEEINSIQGQINSKRELFFKVQGAIEYLQQIGVTVSEVSDTEESDNVD